MRPTGSAGVLAMLLVAGHAVAQDGGLAHVEVKVALDAEWGVPVHVTLCGQTVKYVYALPDGGLSPHSPYPRPDGGLFFRVEPGPCVLSVRSAWAQESIPGLEDVVEVPPGSTELWVTRPLLLARVSVTVDGGPAPNDTVRLISAPFDVQNRSGGLIFDHSRSPFAQARGSPPSRRRSDGPVVVEELPVPLPGRYHVMAWSRSTGMAQGWVEVPGPPVQLALEPGATLSVAVKNDFTVLTPADQQGLPRNQVMRGVSLADGGTAFPHVAGPVRVWSWGREARVTVGATPLSVELARPPGPPPEEAWSPPPWPALEEALPGVPGGQLGHRALAAEPRAARPRTVVGTVWQPDGRPAAGAWVLLLCRDDGPQRPAPASRFQDCTSGEQLSATPHGRPCVVTSTFTDAAGRFQVQAPAREPVVAVDAWRGDQWAHGVPVQGQWLTLTLDEGEPGRQAVWPR